MQFKFKLRICRHDFFNLYPICAYISINKCCRLKKKEINNKIIPIRLVIKLEKIIFANQNDFLI